MQALAFSPLDALLVIGLGLVGFVVVMLVCVAVLVVLHLVLPSADSGATAVDAANARAEPAARVDRPHTEDDA